jgi:hypothetical protein
MTCLRFQSLPTNPHVIGPPTLAPSRSSLRKHKTSKTNKRPVFKEPGSKIPISKPPSTTDVNNYWPTSALHPNSRQRPQDPPPGKKYNIVNGHTKKAQFATDKYLPSHEEIATPSSNATKRLNRIMGRQSFDNVVTSKQKVPSCHAVDMVYESDSPLGLEHAGLPTTNFGSTTSHSRRFNDGRTSRMYDGNDDQSDCGGSIATVSDLDYLASKSLRRKKPSQQLGERRLNLLRQEIKEMVESLEEKDEEEDHHVEEGNKDDNKDDNKDTAAESKGEIQEAIEQSNRLGDTQAIHVPIKSRMSWCRDSLFCDLSVFISA